MYKTVLPEVEKIQNKFRFEDKTSTAKAFYTSDKEGVIMLENLKTMGYELKRGTNK